MFAFVAARPQHQLPTAVIVPAPPSKATRANQNDDNDSCISISAPTAAAPAPRPSMPDFPDSAPDPPASAANLLPPPADAPVAALAAAPASPCGSRPAVTLSEAGSSVSGSPLLDCASTHVGGSSRVMPHHRCGKPPSQEGSGGGEKDWVIEAIACGDGTCDSNGRTLERGLMYGSGNPLGRHESFHPGEMTTANFSTHGGEAVELRTRWVSRDVTGVTRDTKSCPLPAEAVTRGSCVMSRKLIVARGIERFCKMNKGLAVIIGGVGARDSNKLLAPHLVRELGCIPEKGSNGRCVKAALINAVVCLRGSHAAENARVVLQKENKQVQNLKPLGLMAHKLRMNVYNHKHMRREISKDKFKAAFGVVAVLRRDVWIARLCQPRVVDHSVAIDAERDLIFDNAEKFPIRLSAETLRMCRGESATELHVAEVREIVDISH